MLGVRRYPEPGGTVLHAIAQKPGFYTDCFVTEIGGRVTLSEYVEAFYTTPLFKAERLVLRCLGIRSGDVEARQLMAGEADRFAAWHVAERTENQLLMKAIGATSSWFMADQTDEQMPPVTRLLFGTVIAPSPAGRGGVPRIGRRYSALLALHILYSKLLLASARRRLVRLSG